MTHPAIILFLALFGLSAPSPRSPPTYRSSGPTTHKQVNRLALGLAVNVAIFVLGGDMASASRSSNCSASAPPR